MSTGYVIFSILTYTDPDAHFVSVVWEQEAADEIVRRLNALAPDGSSPYAWKEIWVHPKPDHVAGYLTAKDRELLLLARAHDAIGTERPIGVFFSFPFDRDAAIAAAKQLSELGWPKADSVEEATDDDLWHTYGHGRRMLLTGETIRELRRDMEGLAQRLGGEFDGWDVSGGHGLRSELGTLAT